MGRVCIVDPGLAGYVVLLVPVWRALRAFLRVWALGSLPSLPRMGWSAVRGRRGSGGGRAQAAGLKLQACLPPLPLPPPLGLPLNPEHSSVQRGGFEDAVGEGSSLRGLQS